MGEKWTVCDEEFGITAGEPFYKIRRGPEVLWSFGNRDKADRRCAALNGDLAAACGMTIPELLQHLIEAADSCNTGQCEVAHITAVMGRLTRLIQEAEHV